MEKRIRLDSLSTIQDFRSALEVINNRIQYHKNLVEYYQMKKDMIYKFREERLGLKKRYKKPKLSKKLDIELKARGER